MSIKSIRDIDIKGKRVLFRFDFNVPLDESGIIKDDTRIRRALPTIQYAIEQGAKSILTSHLGRPKGEKKPEMSLRPVSVHLGKLLGRDVGFVDDCVGKQVQDAVSVLPDGGVLLLENLRFHAEETKKRSEVCGRTCGFSGRICERRIRYRSQGARVHCRSCRIGQGKGSGIVDERGVGKPG